MGGVDFTAWRTWLSCCWFVRSWSCAALVWQWHSVRRRRTPRRRSPADHSPTEPPWSPGTWRRKDESWTKKKKRESEREIDTYTHREREREKEGVCVCVEKAPKKKKKRETVGRASIVSSRWFAWGDSPQTKYDSGQQAFAKQSLSTTTPRHHTWQTKWQTKHKQKQMKKNTACAAASGSTGWASVVDSVCSWSHMDRIVLGGM